MAKQARVVSAEEVEKYNLQGVEFLALLPREQTESAEVLLETYPAGTNFPLHQHEECEQIYFILQGEAQIQVDQKVSSAPKGSTVYIPRRTQHAIHNTASEELVYLVISVYPEGYPAQEPTLESHMQKLCKHYDEEREKI
jgi:mannose-6-phosphate isomerase-like protein (cupin superfamily)